MNSRNAIDRATQQGKKRKVRTFDIHVDHRSSEETTRVAPVRKGIRDKVGVSRQKRRQNHRSSSIHGSTYTQAETTLSYRDSARKQDIIQMSAFLLDVYNLVTSRPNSQTVTNNDRSVLRHIESARPSCLWCTLTIARGMLFVTQDLIKITKLNMRRVGVGMGLANGDHSPALHDINHNRTPAREQSKTTWSNIDHSTLDTANHTFSLHLDNGYASIDALAQNYPDWFNGKYGSVLRDLFDAVYKNRKIRVSNWSGIQTENFMIIDHRNSKDMMINLYRHLNSEQNIFCKTNTRRKLATMLNEETTSCYRVRGCVVPYVIRAVQHLTQYGLHVPNRVLARMQKQAHQHGLDVVC